jgi:phosphomevalonate kinase
VSRARAPGKLVLSGAYAVLAGAPAIVTAAARYVVADSGKAAELLAPEVAEALAPGQSAPFFDASALRESGRKLGLGSSAAILLASLVALERDADPRVSDEELRARLFGRALVAHQKAQQGGSGVDVAASCFGGTLVYEVAQPLPRFRRVALPPGLVLEVWVCPSSASTRELLALVDALAARAPAQHRELLGAQGRAANSAVRAIDQADTPAFVGALAAQFHALGALGQAAGASIITPALHEVFELASGQGGALLPAGAGGGDIAIFAGVAPSSAALRAALAAREHHLLHVELAAEGAGAA